MTYVNTGTGANTGSLITSFNVDPYYDDFDEAKNFHRILYRPGQAVQARELTQMQTILQNQIDRFGEHIFKEGSVVAGLQINYDNNYTYVKIRDNDFAGTTAQANSFIGASLRGDTSNVNAIVVGSVDGAEATDPNFKTLYIKYIDSAESSGNTYFTPTEKIVANTGLTANVTSGVTAVGKGSYIRIDEGILFAKDHFIKVPAQDLLVGRYSANVDYKIGYEISESVVTADDDSSLNDPAQGSFNFTAPGGNRLKLSAVLTKYLPTANVGANFIEIYRVTQGATQINLEDSQYSNIRDYLAVRTHDINGDFLLRGMNVRLREHLNQANNSGVFSLGQGGDSNKLSVDVEPGKAYVSGYDLESLVTAHLPIDKSTDFDSVEAATIAANYGNYVTVHEVAGAWDVNTHKVVDLYNQAARAISNTQYSFAAPPGEKIGTARVRAIDYSSGSKGSAAARYKLYIYDIQMSANTFQTVKTLHVDNTSGSEANGIADIVLAANGAAVIEEKAFNRTLFRVPARAIKTLRDTTGNVDTNFQFVKKFDVTIASDGTFTLATGAVNETFPFSTGALNTTQKQAGFYIVLNANTTSASTIDTASVVAGANSFTGMTDASTKFNVGDHFIIAGHANTFTVSSVGTTSVNTLQGAGVGVSNAAIKKKFVQGQVIDMSGVGGDGSTRTVTVSSATGAAFDTQETLSGTASATVVTELTRVDGQEKAKILRPGRFVKINSNTSPYGTAGPWNLGLSDVHKLVYVRKQGSDFTNETGGTDVTSHFTLDTGQTDNLYDHAHLKKKLGSTLSISGNDQLLVKVNYFTHDTSQGVGYFSVDSYPIDDVNAANTTAITTQEIPLFNSPISGSQVNLRNAIDIRPRITDTATDTTTVGSASINPANSIIVHSPSGGLRFMAPNENLTADLDFYLSRNDMVSLSPQGQFVVTKGLPSLNPVLPEEPISHLPLTKVFVPPFPSLSPDVGRQFNRQDIAAYLEPVRSRGFKMKDIDDLKDRLDKVEYFTRLSLAEQEAQNFNFADGNGQDRFKNGVIIDTFTGHNIGKVSDPDYAVSVDRNKGEMRPLCRFNSVDLDLQTANSTNMLITPRDVRLTVGGTATFTVGETITAGAATGTLVYQVDRRLYLENASGTFSEGVTASGGTSSSSGTISAVQLTNNGVYATPTYSHQQAISQPFASTSRNAAGLFWNFLGEITLSPDSDFWVDTVTAPDVQINFDANFDNWPGLDNSWQTEWNAWQTTWSGANQNTTVSTNNFTRNRRQTIGNRFNPAFVGQFDIDFRDSFQTTTATTTETITTGQTRTGIRTGIVPQTQTERIGPRLVDTNVIPFMRSRTIQVTGRGFKPNTRLYSFFDGTDVSDFITPTTSAFANTANEGASFVTDGNGDIFGEFRLPNSDNLRFRVGERVFRLTDNSTNQEGQGLVTTSGEVTFAAQGSTQTVQDTVISTRLPTVVSENVSENRTLTNTRVIGSAATTTQTGTQLLGIRWRGRPVDPIAQTFGFGEFLGDTNTGSGAYLSKIDLFFEQRDDTRPVFIEIREVDPSTSYITGKIIPLSRITLEPDDINVSTDGSAATPVHFVTPIFLQKDKQYAIVVKPAASNPNTRLFVSRLGGTDLITSQRITQQPNVGTLFASSNDRQWNAIQEEDLKFNLYIANFSTSPSKVTFKNEDREFLKINAESANSFNDMGETIHSETTLTLSTGISANAGMVLVGNTSGANAIISSNNSGTTSYRVRDVSLTKFSDGEKINVIINSIKQPDVGIISSQSTPTGRVVYYDTVNEGSNTHLHLHKTSGTFTAGHQIKGQKGLYTASIASVDAFEVDTIQVSSGQLNFEDTSVVTKARINRSKTQRDTSFRSILANENNNFKQPKFVLSKSLEQANIGGEKSAEITFDLTTTNPRLAPAIDLERTSMVIIDNKVNNDSTNEDTAGGGNAQARYITRILTLAEGQDAEDIKVKINAYKPVTTEIEVYYKIMHKDDESTFNDLSWVKMTQSTVSTIFSDSEDEEDFKIFDFDIPTDKLTGTLNEVQYINNGLTYTGFKYMSMKVVLKSSSDAIVPRVKDFLAIALQV